MQTTFLNSTYLQTMQALSVVNSIRMDQHTETTTTTLSSSHLIKILDQVKSLTGTLLSVTCIVGCSYNAPFCSRRNFALEKWERKSGKTLNKESFSEKQISGEEIWFANSLLVAYLSEWSIVKTIFQWALKWRRSDLYIWFGNKIVVKLWTFNVEKDKNFTAA